MNPEKRVLEMREKLTVLIDGYNVIRGVPELNREIEVSLEHARNRLIALCRTYRSRLPDTAAVCVIFDGDSTAGPSLNSKIGRVSVVYTATGEEADDRILAMLKRTSTDGKTIIISDDAGIGMQAREFHATMETVLTFYNSATSASRPKRKKRKGPVISDKPVGTAGKEITRELMDLWCENESGIDS